MSALAIPKEIDAIIEVTLGHEGGYSNHPNDLGGPTMWGITQRVARANGWKGSMDALPREEAKRIYFQQYFVQPGFDKVFEVSAKIAAELFDTGVNTGPTRPIQWLQEWLNVLNNGGRDFADINPDGDLGPRTINALRTFFAVRGRLRAETVLLRALNAEQAVFYKTIARQRPANESFMVGWLHSRVSMI